MKNDAKAILEDLLSRWHGYCKGYRITRSAGSDPMFRQAQSGRGWETVDEILDAKNIANTFSTIDFHVSEMEEPHRSAIHELARNLHTGFFVWRSPRLPRDSMERVEIVSEARRQITQRLMKAGVL